jgi:group I intron endonuclease
MPEKLLRDSWTQEKQRLRMSGIYKITNRVSGEFYIGASVDIFARWNSHLSAIRSKKHHVKRINKAFEESGIQHPLDLFEIEVLERTTNLIQKEAEYIRCFNPTLNQNLVQKPLQ